MKKILLLTLAYLVITASASNFDLAKYKQQIDSFCSENKKVCTKETLESGIEIFKNRFKERQEEISRKKSLLKKTEKLRKINQMKEDRYLQILRERFLDRHL